MNTTKCKRIGEFWYILPDKNTKDVFDFIIEYIYTDNIFSIDYEYKGNKNTNAYRNIILKIQNAAKMYKLIRLEEICDEILNRGKSVKKISNSSFFNDMKWGYENLGTTIIEKGTNGNFLYKINKEQFMDLTDFKIVVKHYDEKTKQYLKVIYKVHGDVIINSDVGLIVSYIMTANDSGISINECTINDNYKIDEIGWIDLEAFNFCLTYLYTRTTEGITNDNIIAILMSADRLQIIQLKHIILEKIMQKISQEGATLSSEDNIHFVKVLIVIMGLDDTIRFDSNIMNPISQNVSTDESGKYINLLHKCIYFILRIIKQRNIDVKKYMKNINKIDENDSKGLDKCDSWILYNEFNYFFNF